MSLRRRIKETFGRDGYVHYLYYCVDFTYVYIRQHLSIVHFKWVGVDYTLIKQFKNLLKKGALTKGYDFAGAINL